MNRMPMILTLLAIALLNCAFSVVPDTDALEPNINYSLPTHINPYYYTIKLYFRANKHYSGSSIISLKAAGNSKNITLNSANKNLNITYATLTYKNTHTTKPIKWERRGELLVFHFDHELLGTYNLTIKYKCKLTDVLISRHRDQENIM